MAILTTLRCDVCGASIKENEQGGTIIFNSLTYDICPVCSEKLNRIFKGEGRIVGTQSPFYPNITPSPWPLVPDTNPPMVVYQNPFSLRYSPAFDPFTITTNNVGLSGGMPPNGLNSELTSNTINNMLISNCGE
jgi:hypothetical protein